MLTRWKLTLLYCIGFVLGAIAGHAKQHGRLEINVLWLGLAVGICVHMIERFWYSPFRARQQKAFEVLLKQEHD